MSPQMIVYIIDADGKLGDALQRLLDNYDIQVNAYADSAAFLHSTTATYETSSCLLFTLDSQCEDGLPLVQSIHSARPDLPIIVLCDSPDKSLRGKYIRAGAIDTVSKSMVDAYIFTRLSTMLPGAACLPATKSSKLQLPDGTAVTIRMIRPEDAKIEHDFVIGLSKQSRYLRFFSGMKQLPAAMTRELVDPHFPISYALIATIPCAEGERQIAVARYSPTGTQRVAEFAVVVADEWQRCGIASQLLRYIVAAATVAGMNQLVGLVLRENTPMLKLAEKLGFVQVRDADLDATIVKVMKNLR